MIKKINQRVTILVMAASSIAHFAVDVSLVNYLMVGVQSLEHSLEKLVFLM